MCTAKTLTIKDIYSFTASLNNGNYIYSDKKKDKVFGATHKFTNEKCAIKIMNKKIYAQGFQTKQFGKDVRMLTKLKHLNIVQVFDMFETKKNLYCVMKKLSIIIIKLIQIIIVLSWFAMLSCTYSTLYM